MSLLPPGLLVSRCSHFLTSHPVCTFPDRLMDSHKLHRTHKLARFVPHSVQNSVHEKLLGAPAATWPRSLSCTWLGACLLAVSARRRRSSFNDSFLGGIIVG